MRTGRRIPGVVPLGGVHAPISVVRMAVGDAYGAKEWREGEGDDEVALRTERIERRICHAVAEFSFRQAERMGAKVFGGPKYTVSPIYEGMLKEEMDEAAARHPDVPYEPQLIDATFALLISSSGAPMVIPALNRDGDILSDLVLPLFGSIAGSESLLVAFGDDYVPSALMAEAAHGTAPALEGKDVANPMAMILAGARSSRTPRTSGADRRARDPRGVPRGGRRRRPDRRSRRASRHDRVHRRGHPPHADEARRLGLAVTVLHGPRRLAVEFATACESRSRRRRLRASAASRSFPRPSRSSATPASRCASSGCRERQPGSTTRPTRRPAPSSSDAASRPRRRLPSCVRSAVRRARRVALAEGRWSSASSSR